MKTAQASRLDLSTPADGLSLPAFVLANRQRGIRFDLVFLRQLATAALPFCREAATGPDAPLCSLPQVEATLVSDRRIARVHGDFFADPTPTDVITFPYGEILVGAETVRDNALRFGQSPDEEAALCLVHGLMHLAGWEDGTGPQARAMAKRQEQVFKAARRML